MKLRTRLAPLVLASAIALTAAPVRAQSVDPCTVYACMAGISGFGASGGPGCAPANAVFFAIVVFDPLFDPVSTSLARRTFLMSCPGANVATNEAILQAIIGLWGSVP